MHYTQFDSKIVFRLDPGEELVQSIKKLCEQLNITLGTITGLGATNNVTLGLYEVATKQYHQITRTGDHEIASLYGNITQMNGEVYLHLHITVCDKTYQSISGHLNKAIISVTFEGVIDCIKGTITRHKDQHTGLNILSL